MKRWLGTFFVALGVLQTYCSERYKDATHERVTHERVTHEHATHKRVTRGESKHKKIIVIAWSKGGGAHKSMLDALTRYLSNEYKVIPFNPLDKVLGYLDVIRYGTFGALDAEDFYNMLLVKDMRWTINTSLGFGIAAMRRHTRELEDELVRHLKPIKPDLIISVIPVLNYALNEAGRRLNVPFLLVAPDCDISRYLTDMYPSRPFYCTLPFKDELLLDKATEAWVYPHFIKEYGFPLRPEFFEPKDRESIRKEFKLPAGKPVVMILMGATGSSKSMAYLKHLPDMSLHLVICIGKNESLRAHIERLSFPSSVTRSIVGFTKKIADLMAISDVLITKGGAATVAESVEMQLPLIIDDVSMPLKLERLQSEFVKKHRLGELLTSYSDLPRILKRLLTPSCKASIQERMRPWTNATFAPRVKALIKDILEHAQQDCCTPEAVPVRSFRWLRPG
jgi:processive 1,2-diacylglycerol beta-glucosyltransferase